MSLAEFSRVLTELESVLAVLLRDPAQPSPARRIDDVIGRMTRWVWPVLGDLDEGDAR